VTVLGQNFNRTSDLRPAGHALTGAVGTITPAEALDATELQARLNAALNILLPLDHPATRQLAEVMDRVPFWSMSRVMNPGLVMDLERAVAALQALTTDVQAVTAEIETQLRVREDVPSTL